MAVTLQVESSQSLIRIVGLSATLPNYVDVSDFLRSVGSLSPASNPTIEGS